jgi:hypothetical protein
MSEAVKIEYGGKQYEAVRVEANQSTEHWNQYLLEDGSLLKIKTVVTEIFRVIGEYDGHGNPMYIVRSGNVVSVIATEGLRKK